MLIVVQRVDGLVNPDVARVEMDALLFLKNFRDVIVGFQTHAAGAFHIQNWRDAGFHPFQTGDTGHQRFARQQQALVQQRPESGFVAFRFQRDTRQVQADNAEVVAPIVYLFAVLVFPYTEETAAAHRRFKRPGDFHYLIVVENIRVHAFAGAL